MVTMRSPWSIRRDSAFSSVVLPEPVPPEMRMLSRARAAICSTVRHRRRSARRSSIRRRGRSLCLANLRIEMQGPSSASGGKMMLTRQPSGRRASHHRARFRRSGARPRRRCAGDARSRCASSRKRTSDSASLPLRSTKTCCGPLTMMSVIASSASSGSSGPRPSMSSTSSRGERALLAAVELQAAFGGDLRQQPLDLRAQPFGRQGGDGGRAPAGPGTARAVRRSPPAARRSAARRGRRRAAPPAARRFVGAPAAEGGQCD